MDTISLLNNHRSVRKFKSQTIPQDVLDRILTCGLRASNTGNMQVYSIIVTRDTQKKEELSKLHFGQCATAPAFITVCVDVNRYHHWCSLRNTNQPYDNFLWFLTGTVDATLAAQNICVAAEHENLGFCFLGTVLYNTKSIAQLLELPKGVFPVVTFALGYPDEMPSLSERLPLEGVVHYDTYHHYSDEEINEIHRVREEFPFNQEMVRVNGTENYAQIFTQIRYPKKDNVAISKALLEFLEESGFMNNEE